LARFYTSTSGECPRHGVVSLSLYLGEYLICLQCRQVGGQCRQWDGQSYVRNEIVCNYSWSYGCFYCFRIPSTWRV